MKYRTGQKVTLTHPTYGRIHGTVHPSSNANPYVPLGFAHLTLGKNLERAGWTASEGWTDPRDEVLAILDAWDVESGEATQAALADAIRAVYEPIVQDHANGSTNA